MYSVAVHFYAAMIIVYGIKRGAGVKEKLEAQAIIWAFVA